MKNNTNKGITLIALVITIIVMLILVAVTISMAVNGGLFDYAGKAVGETQNALNGEHQLANGGITIGGKYYNSIDEYLKGDTEKEERKVSVEYTQSEGEELWSSTVTLTISIEDEQTLKQKRDAVLTILGYTDYDTFKIDWAGSVAEYDAMIEDVGEEKFFDEFIAMAKDEGLEIIPLSLDQMRELVAYMVDFSNYEEFKTGIETITGSTYTEAITSYGYDSEEAFLSDCISAMKSVLSYKDIDKLESLGVKVFSVETPYGTTLYTTSLGGDVISTFVENGTYTFTIKSGQSQVTETVEINNIRDYDDQAPHDVKIDGSSLVSYSIDNSEEWTSLSNIVLNDINESIAFKVGNTIDGVRYVIKDEEYYKYFSNDGEWSIWDRNQNAYIFTMLRSSLPNLTCRQGLLFLYLGESELASMWLTTVDGAWADYMDEYWIPDYENETIDEEAMIEKYPQVLFGETLISWDESVGSLNFTKDTHICIRAYYCLTTDTYVEVVIWDEEKKRKIRIRKKLKDVTYEDELLVWDFDKGEFTTAKPLWIMKTKVANKYNLLKFSDGSELKTIDQHRLFNKEAGKFTYPMTDETPIGTTTYTAEGKEVKLVSKEVIVKEVEYTNIITKYHINVFANNILTSCRFSNIYPIEDMKYVKDNREIVGREEYANIPEEYYYGLRLGEQVREANRGNDVEHASTIEEHIQRVYIDNAKEK